MTLQSRILGSSGFKASILGIGDLADRALPLEKCVAAIHRTLEDGLNLIDTALGYEDGCGEAIVVSALRGRREGLFVIDKIDDLDTPAGPKVDASFKALGLGRQSAENTC
jgi:1-deoxyxylulose-5-phosphate synthase